jgi:hypothetical protein
VTYTYGKGGAADLRVRAIARVHGREVILGRGRMHGRTLTLTLRHLHRGRYRLTLLGLAGHGNWAVIGHTTVVVS